MPTKIWLSRNKKKTFEEGPENSLHQCQRLSTVCLVFIICSKIGPLSIHPHLFSFNLDLREGFSRFYHKFHFTALNKIDSDPRKNNTAGKASPYEEEKKQPRHRFSIPKCSWIRRRKHIGIPYLATLNAGRSQLNNYILNGNLCSYVTRLWASCKRGRGNTSVDRFPQVLSP